MKAYTSAFASWVASTEKISRALAIISAETRQILPAADEIIDSAGRKATSAAEGVAASQEKTKLLIIGIGSAVIGLGLFFNWLIGRSITGPLRRLARAMGKLAAGDSGVDIPSTDARDEIGAMARTVIVFRDNMIERDRLTADQTRSARDKEQRSEAVAGSIAAFRNSIRSAAALYDFQAKPENAEAMTFTPEGSNRRVNRCWQLPRSHAEMVQRRKAMQAWSALHCGFMGRSPDHVASTLVGQRIGIEVFEKHGAARAKALRDYFEEASRND